MTDRDRFEQLLRARHRCIRIVTQEEAETLRMVRETAINTGSDMLVWSAVRGVGEGLLAGSGTEANTENPAAALFRLAQVDKPTLAVVLDLSPHLRDDRTLRAWRELVDRYRGLGEAGANNCLVMVDCAEDAPPVVGTDSTRFDLSFPDTAELEVIVRETLRALHRDKPIQVDLTKTGLGTIVRNLRGLSRRQAQEVIVDVVSDDRRLDLSDLNTILATKRQLLSEGGLLEYIEAPVDLTQIGGLGRLKYWLKQREAAMTEDGVKYGLPAPRGVLLLGVQGAGKSLCAKAIATAWKQPLLRMDAGALYDRYVGESERRLRDSLRQAGVMSPIVLWIDEIEKAFASAASQSTDGGLSMRMFATLLTWMQERKDPVFLVATANDIEALPPELLRKGRFDEIFFVDLPGDEARRDILRIHLAKRGQDAAKFDMDTLVKASKGYSGAEIEQAIIAGMVDSFTAGGQLTTPTLRKAMEESPPLSVTMSEHVEALRGWAKGRCVPAE